MVSQRAEWKVNGRMDSRVDKAFQTGRNQYTQICSAVMVALKSKKVILLS